MADTQRTSAALLTLFADNTTGAISPQDLRDGFVSIQGGYGGLKVTSAAGPQSIGTSYAVITGWDANADNDGVNVVPDYTTGTITVNIGAVYLVVLAASFSGTANTTFTVSVHADGVELFEVEFKRKLGSGGDVGSAAATGIIAITDGQVLDVRAKADGAGKDFTLEAGSIAIKRLS